MKKIFGLFVLLATVELSVQAMSWEELKAEYMQLLDKKYEKTYQGIKQQIKDMQRHKQHLLEYYKTHAEVDRYQALNQAIVKDQQLYSSIKKDFKQFDGFLKDLSCEKISEKWKNGRQVEGALFPPEVWYTIGLHLAVQNNLVSSKKELINLLRRTAKAISCDKRDIVKIIVSAHCFLQAETIAGIINKWIFHYRYARFFKLENLLSVIKQLANLYPVFTCDIDQVILAILDQYSNQDLLSSFNKSELFSQLDVLNSLLRQVVKDKDLEAVEKLLRQGAHLQTLSSNRTSYDDAHVFSFLDVQKDRKIIKKLIAYDACDINETYYDGSTLLIRAVRTEDVDLVKLLLQHGAMVNIQEDKSAGKKTALIYAIEKSNIELVELLIEYKANVNEFVYVYTDVPQEVDGYNSDGNQNWVWSKGYSPESSCINLAKKLGNQEIVKRLKEAGAQDDHKTCVIF